MSLLVALVIKGLIIMGIKMSPKIPVVCDGYVKYEEAEVDRSVAILKTNNRGGGPCEIQCLIILLNTYQVKFAILLYFLSDTSVGAYK